MKKRLLVTVPTLFILLLSSTAFSATRQEVDLEKRWLDQEYRAQKSHCNSATHGQKSKCKKRKYNWYKNQLSTLNSDPDLYFYNKEQKERRRDRSRTATDQFGNTYILN